jgi:hypothetical protein
MGRIAMDLLTVLASFLVVSFQVKASKEVVHESTDPPFTLRLPLGYSQAGAPEHVVSFTTAKGDQAWEKVYVDLAPLDGALEPKVPPADATHLRKLPFDIREKKPITLTWEGMEIDGVEIRFGREGTEMVGRCAWVPLFPKAVALCVSAPTTLSKEVIPETIALLGALKGQTRWLTEGESATLQHWSTPAYIAPVLSGLFLVTWVAFLRGQPYRLHRLRIAWHLLVPAVAVVGWFLLQRSAAARLKAGIEAPLYLWFVVIVPLSIFHLVMVTHRIRMAIEMGD